MVTRTGTDSAEKFRGATAFSQVGRNDYAGTDCSRLWHDMGDRNRNVDRERERERERERAKPRERERETEWQIATIF